MQVRIRSSSFPCTVADFRFLDAVTTARAVPTGNAAVAPSAPVLDARTVNRRLLVAGMSHRPEFPCIVLTYRSIAADPGARPSRMESALAEMSAPARIARPRPRTMAELGRCVSEIAYFCFRFTDFWFDL